MRKTKFWSLVLLLVTVLPLVSCGGDDDDNTTPPEPKVYPTYIFPEHLYSEGYYAPDFSSYRGSISDNEENYSFMYVIEKTDENKYRYSFTLKEDIPTNAYGKAKIVWVTDTKYNFTVQWNDKTKEYDITDGYFKGDKIEIGRTSNDSGVYDSATDKFYAMQTIQSCYIHHDGLKIYLGTVR